MALNAFILVQPSPPSMHETSSSQMETLSPLNTKFLFSPPPAPGSYAVCGSDSSSTSHKWGRLRSLSYVSGSLHLPCRPRGASPSSCGPAPACLSRLCNIPSRGEPTVCLPPLQGSGGAEVWEVRELESMNERIPVHTVLLGLACQRWGGRGISFSLCVSYHPIV